MMRVRRELSELNTDRYRQLNLPLVTSLKWLYTYTYLSLTLLLFLMVYCFPSQVVLYIAPDSTTCPLAALRWFLFLLPFLPLSSLFSALLTRRLREQYGLHLALFTFPKCRLRLKMEHTDHKKLVFSFLILDAIHFGWSLAGLILI